MTSNPKITQIDSTFGTLITNLSERKNQTLTGQSFNFNFSNLELPIGDIEVVIQARGDYSGSFENIDLNIEGEFIRNNLFPAISDRIEFFNSDDIEWSQSFILPRNILASIFNDRRIDIAVDLSSSVNVFGNQAYTEIQLNYENGIFIDENLANGTVIFQVNTSDSDPNDTVSLSISNGNIDNDNDGQQAFRFNSNGEIIINDSDELDFENIERFSLEITATDSTGLTDTAEVGIILDNIDEPGNDAPELTPQSFNISTEIITGQSVGVVTFEDVDQNDSQSFEIISGNSDLDGDGINLFQLNNANGEITIGDQDDIDFDTQEQFSLEIKLTDSGNLSDIEFYGINLNRPTVNVPLVLNLNNSETLTVNQSGNLSFSYRHFVSSDSSVRNNNFFNYDLGIFQRSAETEANQREIVYETSNNNFERIKKVYAPENGDFSRVLETFINKSNTTVERQLEVYANLPFRSEKIELTSSGDNIFDSNDNWVITSNANTDRPLVLYSFGNNEYTRSVDYFSGSYFEYSYDFSLTEQEEKSLVYFISHHENINDATDIANNIFSLPGILNSLSTKEFQNIENFNFLIGANPGFTIQENSTTGTIVGVIETLNPLNESITFEIIGGNNDIDGDLITPFRINSQTGEIKVNDRQDLDFELIRSFELAVKATSNSGLVDQRIIEINLENLDEPGNEPPVVNFSEFEIPEGSPFGSDVGSISAVDVDPNDSISFSITAGNIDLNGNGIRPFTINSDTGNIRVLDPGDLNHEQLDQYNLSIQATDSGNLTDTRTIAVKIADLFEVIGSDFSERRSFFTGTLYRGLGGNDIVSPSNFTDILNGGEGIDTLNFRNSGGPVSVNLLEQKGFSNQSKNDIYINFENIIGSDFDDTLVGDDGNNEIQGLLGNDIIRGNQGIDTYKIIQDEDISISDSSASFDTNTVQLSSIEQAKIKGGLSGNVMDGSGFSGKIIYISTAGSDEYTGGTSSKDTISYLNQNIGYTINLSTGIVTKENSTQDTLTSIENIRGSKGDDSITGNDQNNLISGSDGNDTLDGGLGNDKIFEVVNNTLGSLTLTNTSLVGRGRDSITNFEIAILRGNGNANILNAFAFNAGRVVLIGGEGDDALIGGEKNDILKGQVGKDILTGGLGKDKFVYESLDDVGDTILDFDVNNDIFQINGKAFKGNLGTQININQFEIGANASSTDSRFIYNQIQGELFFDVDGDGTETQILVANLSKNLNLSRVNFQII